IRHLISGDDCAIAGEATAAAAAPAAETFKKSRRFIRASPCCGRSPGFPGAVFSATRFRADRRRSRRGFNTEGGDRKREEGMTARFKRKSHMARKQAHAAAMTLWS